MNTVQTRMNKRGQGGFTLIELLVVIAILAILAGVVVFAVGNSTDNAKLTACKAEAKTLSTAANAAKASRLGGDSTTTYASYLDDPTLTYFTATNVGAAPYTGVTFAKTAAGTAQAACTQPNNVTY